MEIRVLRREGNHLSFFLGGIDVSIANSLRRIMMAEVPSMAIEDVIIIENSSPMKDEVLAHRLGFIPLRTDLDSYVLPEKCTCGSELGCGKCSVTLTLESEAPDGTRTVYSSELKPSNPGIVPVSDKIPIVKLAQGQRVRLEAYAKLGVGRNHAKWQPVSQCAHKYAPAIHIDHERCNLCKKCIDACLKKVLAMNGSVKIVKSDNCNLCKECVKACPREAIRVEWLKDSFIFNVESTGALPPERIFLESIKTLSEKTVEFTNFLAQLKTGGA